MQSVFSFHDRSLIELYAYSLRPSDGSTHRQMIEKGVEHFREVSHLDSLSIAARIAEDGIHVLVHPHGDTKRTSRLHADEPRPSRQ